MYKSEVLISSTLKLFSLAFVITSFGLWLVAGLDVRARFKDAQTFISGAIWSQTILPIGLLLSFEELYDLVHAFYLISGTILLISAGLYLITNETYKWRYRPRSSSVYVSSSGFNKYYFGIGTCLLLASLVTFADLMLLISHL